MTGPGSLRGRLRLALLLACLPLAAAADPQDIEDGEPVTLEGADIEPLGRLAMQFSGTYAHAGAPAVSDLVQQGPTFKLGLGRGFQLSVNPNYNSGSDPPHNSGYELTDLKIRLNGETAFLPTAAVDIFQSLPFGAGPKSAGFAYRGILQKALAGDDGPHVFVNVTDYRLNTPPQATRKDQWQLAAGGSADITPRDALVADVVTGAAERIHASETFLELGWSRDLPANWTCQLGAGRQVGGQGSGFRVFFAIEKEVQLF